jgi:hypothetical protein
LSDLISTAKKEALSRSWAALSVAPAVSIVGVAVFYVSGWAYMRAYERSFGVQGLIEHQLNSILAQGAFLFQIELLVSFLLLFALLKAAPFLPPWSKKNGYIVKLVQGWLEFGGAEKANQRTSSLLLWLYVGQIIVACLFTINCAVLLSMLLAERKVQIDRNSVSAGCSRCVSYKIAEGWVYGVPIGSDKTNLALLVDAENVRILRWASIEQVSQKKQAPTPKQVAQTLPAKR